MFTAKKATRENVFVKIALMAPSGGGKTYSALRLATGMAQEIEKEKGRKARIILANTEGSRGYYYANEFNYEIVDIEAPYTPEKFASFVNWTVSEGYDICIIDSSSHEWDGKGGCLELHQQAGGRYQDWGKVTPRHDKFIESMSKSSIHLISTMRGKDKYEMEKDESTGKTNVSKLGVGAKQRDGFEYEFTCTFTIDQKTSMATHQKDNTHLFEGEVATLLTEEHGVKLIQWANSGKGKNINMMAQEEPKKEISVKVEDVKIKEIKVETTNDAEDVVKSEKPSFTVFKKELITLCKEKASKPEIGGQGVTETVETILGEGRTLSSTTKDDYENLIRLKEEIEKL